MFYYRNPSPKQKQLKRKHTVKLQRIIIIFSVRVMGAGEQRWQVSSLSCQPGSRHTIVSDPQRRWARRPHCPQCSTSTLATCAARYRAPQIGRWCGTLPDWSTSVGSSPPASIPWPALWADPATHADGRPQLPPTCVDPGPLPVPSFHPITSRLGPLISIFPPPGVYGGLRSST